MDISSPLPAMALPTDCHTAVDLPINQSGELPASRSTDDCLNDPNEVHFSPEDDQRLIPAETDATAKNPAETDATEKIPGETDAPAKIPAKPDPPAMIPAIAGLPRGCRFLPNDVELILYYLQPEFTDSASAPKGIITPLDVYCYEPHQLKGMAEDYGEGKMYFYTYVKKLGKRKLDRSIRSRPGHHWKANRSLLPVLDSGTGNTVGYKTHLAYHEGKEKTQWLMQEFRLNHTSGASRELVLAVIYYHNQKRKREEDEEDS